MAEEYPSWATAIVTEPYTDAKIPRLLKIVQRNARERKDHAVRYRKRIRETVKKG